MRPSILVVEDDLMIRELVCIYLRKAGYEVMAVANGEDAKTSFRVFQPCLVILDRMLPKISGEELCNWFRSQKRNEVSIIMLSAKAKTQDKIDGLKMGADDYMTKPFEPDELVAHVEAVLRRTGQFCQKITFGGLTIQPRKGEVRLFGEKLSLTKNEFNLLFHFMDNPDMVLSRDDLIYQLYPYDNKTVMERTIDAHIKNLREKIEEEPSSPKRILTVRGMGYKFVHD